MIDTHAHLDDEKFDDDRTQVLQRSFDSGIEKIITIGAGLGSSRRAAELARSQEHIFAAVGCHPEYFMRHGSWGRGHQEELEKLAQAERVVAIGEIGLEYHSHDGEIVSGKQKDLQKEGFIFQLELAKRLKKPVIIHCRGERAEAGEKYRENAAAYEDALKIMEKFPELNFVFHSFGGRLDFAKKVMARKNIFFSFNGNITYAKPGAEILEVVKIVPLEKMMLETDCPYLAPVPHRGKRNEPSLLVHVCGKIAEIKQISAREIEKQTTENAVEFFSL